ncbi:hypothetical protein CPB86DRAFT_785753 [Serendipita vermifera]|nr:hypothetical protein CPB86DRAFT_789459 [Serendipita vermifera]PVF97451.1 hypothetical protein CPB86DRAFT_785753 [Serendipita vermifera]
MSDKWMIWLAIGVVTAVILMVLIILHREIRVLYRRVRGIESRELQQHKLESTDNELVRNV